MKFSTFSPISMRYTHYFSCIRHVYVCYTTLYTQPIREISIFVTFYIRNIHVCAQSTRILCIESSGGLICALHLYLLRHTSLAELFEKNLFPLLREIYKTFCTPPPPYFPPATLIPPRARIHNAVISNS